jgi:hypothetical protein
MRTIDELISELSGTDEGGGAERMPGIAMSLAERLAALKEKARRIGEPCPFKPGDLVTVSPRMDVRGRGQPHIVVEVLAEPVVDTKPDGGSNQFLRRYTMRVAHFVGEDVTVHAVDHSAFERWREAHEAAWLEEEARAARRKAQKVTAGTALTEVVRLLRGEARRLADARISWKKGDLVEILGHEESRAAVPMLFEGRAVGVVETVDRSDETTRVVYFDAGGDRRTQWFKPVDLRPFTAVEAVEG